MADSYEQVGDLLKVWQPTISQEGIRRIDRYKAEGRSSDNSCGNFGRRTIFQHPITEA